MTALRENDALPSSLRAHMARFLDFVAPYTTEPSDAPLRLKVEHSLRVFEHARFLAAEEALPAPQRRAAALAGLYHDCGRFPQFRRYSTFLDAASANHARLGLDILKNQGFLAEESQDIRHMVQAAVLLHNRYSLPPRLAPEVARIVDMVRDADKLDILRIMVSHLDSAMPEKDAVLLNVKDEPDLWTPKVLADVMAGNVARYSDLRYVNDFRLLLGTWLHDLHFAGTRRALKSSGLMESVLQGLPPVPNIQHAVAYLRGLLNK